jgi:hypothetical protein
MAGDIVEHYRGYLERFEALAGPGEFGTFVKHRGRLIKKLRYDEFEPRYGEYLEIQAAYQDSLARGDTLNDVVVKLLRDRASELLLEPTL